MVDFHALSFVICQFVDNLQQNRTYQNPTEPMVGTVLIGPV